MLFSKIGVLPKGKMEGEFPHQTNRKGGKTWE
jgi:hypothetical protein